MVEHLLMVWWSLDRSFMVDRLSYFFLFHPVLHNWHNEGLICAILWNKNTLMLIKRVVCVVAGFLSHWTVLYHMFNAILPSIYCVKQNIFFLSKLCTTHILMTTKIYYWDSKDSLKRIASVWPVSSVYHKALTALFLPHVTQV